jgi:tetratricopeptide (TPR) repeat protein
VIPPAFVCPGRVPVDVWTWTGFQLPRLGTVQGARTVVNPFSAKPERTLLARPRKAAFGGSFLRPRRSILVPVLFAAIGCSQGCSQGTNDEGKTTRTSAEWYQSAYDKRHHHDFDGAIADASEAIKADPNNAKAWLERGISRNNKKDFDGALEDCNRAVQLAPEYADCIRIRGEVKARMKDYIGAIGDYNAAIKLSPKFSRAYGNRAEAYHAMGQDDLALADYDTSIALDGKSYPWFIQARDSILRAQGKKPADPATQTQKP